MKLNLKKACALVMALSLTVSVLTVAAFADGNDGWKEEKAAVEAIKALTADSGSKLAQFLASDGNGHVLNSADADSTETAYTQAPAETAAADTAASTTADTTAPAAQTTTDTTVPAAQTADTAANTTTDTTAPAASTTTDTTAPAAQTADTAASTTAQTMDSGSMSSQSVQNDALTVTVGEVAQEVGSAAAAAVSSGKTCLWRVDGSDGTLRIFVGFPGSDGTSAAVLMEQDGTWKCGTAQMADGVLRVADTDAIYGASGNQTFAAAAETAVFETQLRLYAGSSADETQRLTFSGTVTLPASEGITVYTAAGTGANPIDITADVTLYLDGVTISGLGDALSAITVEPGVKAVIVVRGDSSLTGGTGGAGIAVPAASSLDLSGTASLTAVGNNGADGETKTGGAGIGGAQGSGDSGTITIHDLAGLTAEGFGIRASGIGSASNSGDAASACGAVTIRNTAIARVQGGLLDSASIDSKHTSEGGSAIGGGIRGGVCGAITIENSAIAYAEGGIKAAAIGTGCWSGDCAGITITGSTLTSAQGGGCGGAGIGLGRYDSEADAGVTIQITGSTVNAQGGAYGPAIGTSSTDDAAYLNADSDSSVTIDASTVSAIGGQGAAGIGGGYRLGNVDVTIANGSSVYAQGGILAKYSGILLKSSAAAIGSGAYGSWTPGSGCSFSKGGVSKACTAAEGITDFYGRCAVSIDGSSSVTAVSAGGKWAIDYPADKTGGAQVLQGRFLNSLLMNSSNFGCDAASVAADGSNQILDISHSNTVVMGGRTVVLPENYTCAAVTVASAGTYSVTSAGYTPAGASFITEGTDDRSAAPSLAGISGDFAVSGKTTYFDYLAFRPANQPTPAPVPTPGGDDPTPAAPSDPVTIPDPETPAAQLPDTAVPAAETPADIPDEAAPAAETPDTTASAPKTGDAAALWLALAGLSGIGCAVLSLKKKPDAE